MTGINVREINKNSFVVTVTAQSTTSHEVNVDPVYVQKLTSGKIPTAELVKKSFEFLLERESNNSILRQFDLSVINQYLPEYEQKISKL